MATRSISATRVIDAPPAAIFDILANPARHAEIDGSGSVRKLGKSPQRLSPGATFGMSMKLGIGYSVTNVVTTYEENREIAWRHGSGGVWRYRLERVEDGTMVTESFEYGGVSGAVIGLLGFPARNRLAMEQTMRRLGEAVGPGS